LLGSLQSVSVDKVWKALLEGALMEARSAPSACLFCSPDLCGLRFCLPFHH
jgi:hypothetical protein